MLALFEIAMWLLRGDLYTVATLEPTFYYYIVKQETCEEKLKKLEKRYSKDNHRELEKIRNRCRVIHDKPLGESEIFEYYTCECQRLHYLFFDYMRIWKNLKRGILPFKGGYLEQPAVLMKHIEMIDGFVDEYKRKEEEKQARKARNRK